MICPNCKAKNSKGYTCTNCGIDIVFFTKTVKVSTTLYNKALYNAKEMNLSLAIDLLNKSITFNKNNYQARNLLGLIYYDLGRIGDALKQWIISASIMKKDNLAAEYLERIQNNEKEIYTKNEAVVMYNKALEYINHKSEDMAIIQLKKSIEINPRFINSINLLTFCYLIQNNKEESKKNAYNALKIDPSDKIALSYYKHINGKPYIKPQAQKKISNIDTLKHYEKKPTTNLYNGDSRISTNNKNKFKDSLNYMQLISFFLGVFCTIILMYILIIPGIVRGKDATIKDLNYQLDAKNQLHEEELLRFNETILELESKNIDLNEANNTLQGQIELQNKIESLDEARRLFNLGNNEDAADILYEINFDVLPEYILDSAYELRTNTFTRAGLSLYNAGLREFNRGNLEDSRVLFERSLRYAPEGANYIDDAIYFKGRIEEENGNIDLAINYFRTVVEEHPDSNMFRNATNRLNALESLQ